MIERALVSQLTVLVLAQPLNSFVVLGKSSNLSGYIFTIKLEILINIASINESYQNTGKLSENTNFIKLLSIFSKASII